MSFSRRGHNLAKGDAIIVRGHFGVPVGCKACLPKGYNRIFKQVFVLKAPASERNIPCIQRNDHAHDTPNESVVKCEGNESG